MWYPALKHWKYKYLVPLGLKADVSGFHALMLQVVQSRSVHISSLCAYHCALGILH